MKNEAKKKLWKGIGISLFIIAAIWMAIGFYAKNFPCLLLLLLGSGFCIVIGTKIPLDD